MTNDIYGIEKWGKSFFKILENGSLGLLNPLKKKNKPIDLNKIVKKLDFSSLSATLYWGGKFYCLQSKT